jgi:hypothetical protein
VVVEKARVAKEARVVVEEIKITIEKIADHSSGDKHPVWTPMSNNYSGCYTCGSFEHKQADCDAKDHLPS